MKDNFDLKKFLAENNTLENSNPFLTESYDKSDAIRKKIREMVLSELNQETPSEMMEAEKTSKEEESTEETIDTEETVDITDEENIGTEDDVNVPEMEGDEGEILNHLMKALGMAKSKGDEKLINQIGNTVTFLTRQYISGE
tara:strand:- start:41 stop:466 length:426 start_codon:yes stop_codon:yes gene_type:complete